MSELTIFSIVVLISMSIVFGYILLDQVNKRGLLN